jgi:hypothetical protein
MRCVVRRSHGNTHDWGYPFKITKTHAIAPYPFAKRALVVICIKCAITSWG